MPPKTETCIVARGPITLRPGGRPAETGQVVLNVDLDENARALRRRALVVYEGKVPEDAIEAPTRPIGPEPSPELAPLTVEELERLRVADLQDLAADRGVDVSGLRRKPALIERLVAETTTAPGGDDQ